MAPVQLFPIGNGPAACNGDDEMIDTIEQTIRERDLFSPATPVIAMVSGGSDSTALAYLLSDFHRRGLVGQPAILHVNHKLRGRDADDDQLFVERLAEKLSIPFFACEIDIAQLADSTGGNVEVIGRNERYLAAHEALESLCRHEAIPISEGRIVTAHTQDDRVENFFMRSITGAGPGGFRSMLYRNGPVVRPCLDVSRQDLRDFVLSLPNEETVVDGEGRRWREDATNAHTDRFRAFVRHEIVPKAKERNPRLLDTLCRTMNLIADEDDYLDSLASRAARDHLEWIGAFAEGGAPDGCRLLPEVGCLALPLKRRVVLAVLGTFLGRDARIESASIEAVLDAFDGQGAPKSGFVANIQGDLAVSANKQGVLIEPMAVFRSRRKPHRA